MIATFHTCTSEKKKCVCTFFNYRVVSEHPWVVEHTVSVHVGSELHAFVWKLYIAMTPCNYMIHDAYLGVVLAWDTGARCRKRRLSKRVKGVSIRQIRFKISNYCLLAVVL